MRIRVYLPLFFCLLVAARAGAVDGVIEINAQAAQLGAITAGDTPGFPVTLSESGSYRLTGDLFASTRSVTLISITAERVSLDLNGFTVGICLSGGFCGIGSANAITATGSNVRIHNGMVAGAAGACIQAGAHSTIENVHASRCGAGIVVGVGARVVGVLVSEATGEGVSLGRGAMLADSVVSQSAFSGVRVDFSALVVDSVIRNNGGAFTSSGGGNFTSGGYRGCLIVENDGIAEIQPISGPMRNLGGNICGSDSICP